MAALQGLGRKKSGLSDPELVWERLEDSRSPSSERVSCLLALERTRTIDRDKLRDVLTDLGSFESHFAARCFITEGDKEGVRILLDILEGFQQREGLDGESRLLRKLTRHLLVEISGVPLPAGERGWPQWYEGLDSLEPRRLRPPKIDVWTLK